MVRGALFSHASSQLTYTARKLPAASKKKKKKNAGKNYGGAFSASLAEQWELDRKSKAQKKAERAAVRAAAREAESRDAYRGGRTAGKKAKAAREAASQSNDAATINKQIRQFIQYEIGMATMSLPPMSKKSRIAVHLLAEAYGLKSRSMGKGNARFPVLERTSRTTVVGVSERKIVAIVGTADGEDEMSMGYGYGGRPRGGGKMSGLWKALEGASGKRSGGGAGRSGGGGGVGRNSEGAVVGQGVRAFGVVVPVFLRSLLISSPPNRPTSSERKTLALPCSKRWGESAGSAIVLRLSSLTGAPRAQLDGRWTDWSFWWHPRARRRASQDSKPCLCGHCSGSFRLS